MGDRMGKASRLKAERAANPQAKRVFATHEPEIPDNWPDGHVDVAITDPDDDECIEITIHGVKHYLHSTTARALSDKLIGRLDEWNETARAQGARGV